ncbi:uncharacterized protein [Aristolochia californica]|uniref:uncharacterized protein isoform X2 n=1 Tax=Aristolochia californica TaxID=171875 RepID=UPI0035DEF0C0
MEASLKIEKRKRCTGVSTRDSKISTKCEANQMEHKPAEGNILWVRTTDCSWWPAQVVGYNCTNVNNKSKWRKEGEVLARLYGSSELLYVDPAKYSSDFENALKQNNCSFQEILRKSLEQEISQKRFGLCSNRVACEFKEKNSIEDPWDKVKDNRLKQKQEEEGISQKVDSSGMLKASNTQRITKKKCNIISERVRTKSSNKFLKQNMALRNQKTDDPHFRIHSLKDSSNSRSRPKKMMQKLGLIAPLGSPFCKNGLHQTT